MNDAMRDRLGLVKKVACCFRLSPEWLYLLDLMAEELKLTYGGKLNRTAAVEYAIRRAYFELARRKPTRRGRK